VTTPPTTAALVLAAGRSIRFGAATKQLADVDGRPLVAQVVATALATDVDEVVVVVGHDADRVAAAVPDDPRVRTVTNPDPAAGIAASLCTGVAALAHTVERLVILLGDQPGIDPALVDRVLAAVTDHPAARVRYRDHPGHPVAFARPTFTALTAITGDVGARQLLERLDTHEVVVDADSPADVDTPADL
jgi:molybdenum cofactor cytidylyltransferase